QHEYAKSIRDIQRQFARLWLHYDSVLGEPVPELTILSTVWSGVTSTTFTALDISNGILGISSPLFEEQTITYTGASPANIDAFASGLQRHLQQFHTSFRIVKLNSLGEYQYRIDASIPFEITNATNMLFVP